VAHTLRQISGVVARMDQAPQADRLRYCYWAGKWHLLEHRVGVVGSFLSSVRIKLIYFYQAYSLLMSAFNNCPNKMARHKRSVYHLKKLWTTN
jgi:hypothetical protein